MSYRLGVDVGGTFTDVCSSTRTAVAPGGRRRPRPRPTSPSACSTASTRSARDAGIDRPTIAAGAARHDGRDQRDPRGQGRDRRPGDHRGLPAGAADRPLVRARRPGRLDHLAQARAAGRAGEHRRGRPSGSPATARSSRPLDEDAARAPAAALRGHGIEALAISLINAFANDAHERRIARARRRGAAGHPGVAVQRRAAGAARVRAGADHGRQRLRAAAGRPLRRATSPSQLPTSRACTATLSILRSDGGLAAADAAVAAPVTMLLSGPAGGVTGAVWVAEQSGHRDLLTFDMGGTSTDVALVQDLKPRIGRETKVGDLDGAGVRGRRADGRRRRRIDRPRARAHQGAARRSAVGRRRSRARPPTARAAPSRPSPTRTSSSATCRPSLAGGEITLDVEAARAAVQKVADAMGLPSVEAAAAGIIDIVNENMLGGLRLVSVQQGFDPRDFALVAFGGAGPLHANAIGRADRRLAGDRAAVARRAVRARRRHHLAARRVGAHLLRRFADLDRRRAARDPDRARRGRRRRGWPRRGCRPTSRPVELRGRRPLLRPGLRDPGRRRPGLARRPGRLADRARRAPSTPSTSGCSPSCSASTTSWSTPAPRSAARGRRSRRRRWSRATATRPPRGPAPPGLRRAARFADAGDLRPRAAPGRRRARRSRRSSPRWTRPPWSCPATHATVARVGQPADPADHHRKRGLSHGTHHRDHDRTVATADVDPVTLDLIENGLRNARYEMDEVLFRTALSPGIREQHDEFPLIADPAGKMVVGQFGLSIPDFLDGFDGDIGEGDVLLTSDPYACGAAISHANDWLVVMPIFVEGRLVGWASMFGHMSDVGGKTPSSMPTDAQDHLRGGRGHPAVQAVQRRAGERGRAADHPEPGPRPRLEPGRPERPGRRLPDREPAGAGDVRPVRHRDLPVRAGRAAAAQLRRHEDAAARWCSRRAGRCRSPTTSATTASATGRTS